MSIKSAFCLTDYKNFGSYKVAKCLGIEAHEENIIDKNGDIVLLKTGKNKGNPKTRKIYRQTGVPDLKNETLQLNQYRIMFEAIGFPVSRMNLQVIVRDGATYIAKSRGILKNMYVIDIPRMLDEDVSAYYKNLQYAVDNAFLTGWAPRCTSEESWDGRRCKGYCDVSAQCAAMEEEYGQRITSY